MNQRLFENMLIESEMEFQSLCEGKMGALINATKKIGGNALKKSGTALKKAGGTIKKATGAAGGALKKTTGAVKNASSRVAASAKKSGLSNAKKTGLYAAAGGAGVATGLALSKRKKK